MISKTFDAAISTERLGYVAPQQQRFSPKLLRPDDTVRVVSPASTPLRDDIQAGVEIVKRWGLNVELGAHVWGRHGYLAGTDEERLKDINDAIRDPKVRAIWASRGGAGSFRIADRLDFDTIQKDPKFFVGYSDITAIHLALLVNCRLGGIHGSLSLHPAHAGLNEILRETLMSGGQLTLHADEREATSVLSMSGIAEGVLLGGNLEMISTAAGWSLPSLKHAILFIEGVRMGLGRIDRLLTMLTKSGCLDGVAGVAVGRFAECGDQASWSAIDVLSDHLHRLNVPVLGGLPFGHGGKSHCLRMGDIAILDASSGSLTVGAKSET